jgi:predicted ATPase
MPVEQVEARLYDRFRLLTGGSRTALPRQQTLRALIDWSYDLLAAIEKALLLRLSVFAGGWTVETAERVCADQMIEEWRILDVLTTLVDKSLVLYEEQGSTARYRLLETVRRYAAERLTESGESRRYRSRHSDYFLGMAEDAGAKMIGSQQGRWLDRLEADHDNLRQAFAFCLEEEDCEAGLRLGAALQQFWLTRGYLSEGRDRLAAILSLPGAGAHSTARANALNGAGTLAWMQGDYATARSLHEESLRIRRELGDKYGIATSLNNLGLVAHDVGDDGSAAILYGECLETARELGDDDGVAMSLNNLAPVVDNQGDWARARSLYEEALSINRRLGNRSWEATNLNGLGCLAFEQGDYSSARSLHEASLQIRRELGNRYGIASSLNNLGQVSCEQGQLSEARTLFKESLRIRRDLGDKQRTAYSLESLAGLDSVEGRPEQAARLWGAAEKLREDIGSPMPANGRIKQDQDVAAARTAISEEAFLTAWTEGRAMTMEQAIECALRSAAYNAAEAKLQQ